tara:strand:+ start:4348 stop:5397 length:1050 start_codon:yes stop_codon:yes gene_type:complete
MTDVFPLSLIFCFLLWFLNKSSNLSFLQNVRATPQTYHKKSTSRLGGLAIFFPLLITSFFLDSSESYEFLKIALLCSIPIFLTGLLDDLQIEIKPSYRIILMLPTPILFYFVLGIRIESVGIDFFDILLEWQIISALFLVFSIVGIVNAFNIIDGFNGLLLSYCLTILISLIVGYEESSSIDWLTFNVAIFLSVLAVFFFNFPFGKIFLGDAGAYLLGALIPIGLIKYTFDNNFSPWFVLAILIYPVSEVIISVVRKVFFRKMSALKPDGLHFHMLVYKKVTKRVGFKRIRLRHFVVTNFIFFFNFPFLLSANYFKQDTLILVLICLWYFVAYLLVYFIMLPKYAFRKT